ncbi:MAG TPA: right-handed parallel beta-helix repeat-containing protein [Thermoanaerobaculia bacterium]|nr:right-handed parallel beta-helix repeat-containing protein [Thermoanaerobaculia bacterium]
MAPVVKWAAAVCAAAIPLFAAAQEARGISGSVYDDPAALAVRQNFVPVGGVTVKLYRDGGDRTPSADDIIVATTTTTASGAYTFPQTRSADYWVAIDSRTVRPRTDTWAEQTFGPAGSLCVRHDGTAQPNYFEGACVGGKTSGSDDASSLATSEHIALVSASESRANVDFAFSFNAVTSVADGDRVQGSLRQFVRNANAINGANHMRFVPVTPAPEQRDPIMGVPTRWWVIALGSPLPELTDEGTLIDGTAHHLLSPASVTNIHPGRLGEAPTIQPQDRTAPLIEKVELEVTVAGGDGIVCAARCAVRALAMHGAATGVIARGDARIEHVMIGASPDGVPAPVGSNIGVQLEKGVTTAQHLLVTMQSRAGIIVAPGARLDGERLDVNRCGEPQSGGGIVLLSDGSSIKSSIISANPGAGIILGSLDGATPAHANTIDGSTISSNQAGVILGAGSSRNSITRNDIMWNRVGGVTSAPFDTTPPRENRVSANRFDENGLRPIILDLATQNPNELSRGAESCDRIANAPNNGIAAPRLTDVRVQTDASATRVTVRGRACPGQIVEIYQSYVTSGIRDKQPDLPRIRGEKIEGETLTNQQREMMLPSVGEFNYLGATNAAADGTFEATFPLPVVKSTGDPSRDLEETNIWASEVLRAASPSDRAFSAIAIDASGNTSEMSVRRQVD